MCIVCKQLLRPMLLYHISKKMSDLRHEKVLIRRRTLVWLLMTRLSCLRKPIITLLTQLHSNIRIAQTSLHSEPEYDFFFCFLNLTNFDKGRVRCFYKKPITHAVSFVSHYFSTITKVHPDLNHHLFKFEVLLSTTKTRLSQKNTREIAEISNGALKT
ncbi:hypothetical protein BDC45DRAFT_536666 [Circinella umbellata]|nr:hypothetical protein BDC45DRAFT_536666 [Circinella umbellata]